MTSSEKTKFRQTALWKRFREQLIRKRGLKCELLGTKLTIKTAQVHHLHPEEYDNLRGDWFKVLSPTAHDFVEHVARIVHGHTDVPNREALLAWIGPFLPTSERTVDKYYRMMEEEK